MANEAKWPEMMQRYNHIYSLSDELLIEILRRLPNYKSVVKCKAVCKHWAALITHPWFFSQFVGLREERQAYGIVMWSKPDRLFRKFERDRLRWLEEELEEEEEFESCFEPLMFNASTFHFPENYFKPTMFDAQDLPFSTFPYRGDDIKPSMFNAQDSSFSPFTFPGDDDNNNNVKLVASCNDLLLYCRHEKDKKYDFYINNAQTRDFGKLPSPPHYYGRLLRFGLICDPFYSRGKEIVMNDTYCYSVIVIRYTSRTSAKFRAHVLSSTNHGDGQWCDRVLSLPKTCTFTGRCSGFCFDGKLYFNCREGIFGFDQNTIEFDDKIRCHLIEWPIGMIVGSWHRVGFSQENLMMSQLAEGATLHVWVLKDYKTSNWILQHKIEISDWMSCESWMTDELKGFSEIRRRIDVLGFHPSNDDIIYMLIPGYIFLCELSTKTLQLACRIPMAVFEMRKYHMRTPSDFLVMLPSWPTPLPRLRGRKSVCH